MVTLKAVLHYKEVHTNESWISSLSWRFVVGLHYFTLTNLICALYFLNEFGISINAIALFKNDRVDLC